MVNPNDSTIKFNPRRDNQGDYREVNPQKTSSNSPAPSKPFRDVMDQSSGGSRSLANRKHSLDEDEIALAEGDTSTPSIFDMPTTQAKAKAALKNTPAPLPFAMQDGDAEVADAPAPSPATLYQTLSKNDAKTALHSHTSNETANLEGKIAPGKNQNINPFDKDALTEQQAVAQEEMQQPPMKEKEKFNSQFGAKEQPDLSYLNPLGQPTLKERMVESSSQRAPLLPALTAQQIVEQIVHHMEVQDFKATGLTNTTVTLNYPPIFEKAQVVVTSFDTARNEFNITFQNLGPQAKKLMDQQATQDSLKHTLETKGYMIHIITATTTIAQPVITDADNQFRGYRDQQDEQQQNRKGKQEDEEKA